MDGQCQVGAQMPKYKCHKEVWALKIASLRPLEGRLPSEETDGSLSMIPEDNRFGPMVLDAQFVRKHNPKVGGYYVVYEDGYQSWSPAEAFESGYTRI